MPRTPQRRNCATVQTYFALVDSYPDYRKNQRDIEMATRKATRTLGLDSLRTMTTVVTLPVVVHIIHRTERENISDAQVHSQIDVLNKDFRGTNSDFGQVPQPFQSLAGDARIQFVLAREAPDGSTTTGITRTKTARASFDAASQAMKATATGGIDPWDTTRYLNIWVCTLQDSLLGYAQFPGGPPETDGVVILNTAFGTTGTAKAPFNLGRTATHEIGHFLNLSHIWGEARISTCDDGDYVDDTPNQLGPNTGKPNFPLVSCPASKPNGDMFMNYMDYVDDAAMFMFSLGQIARMHATLEVARKPLADAGAQLAETV
ncbi:zinc metalloprotease [Azospirillum brasilense]|uniref:zinc metalloprotease n=1 Tax=Azospirillum brasilense TaxID=192 RepID=UPI001EDB42C6|nr:zinc metalloprotease [Azospirillum brasilense]UKJ74624.1 zinc metalloprotease [Azospirillum brasilense]